MSKPVDRKGDAERRAKIDGFTASLGRLVTLAQFLLSTDEHGYGGREYPDLELEVRLMIRYTFIEAEWAGHAAGFDGLGPLSPPSWGSWRDFHLFSRHGTPPWYLAPLAGHHLYKSTLDHVTTRWGCREAVYRDEGGSTWIATVYPEDFPNKDVFILPCEHARLKAAFDLVKLDWPPGDYAPQPPEVEPDLKGVSKTRICKRLRFKSPSYWPGVLGHRDAGNIKVEPSPLSTAKRERWDLWILKPEKFPPDEG